MVCLTRCNWLWVVGLVAAVGIVAAPVASAQEAADIDPLEDLQGPERSSDPFNSDLGPMQLIHQLMRNGTSLSDFNQRQQGRISDEVRNFRQQQQEALRSQPQASPAPAPESDEAVQ
ncbi:hypothetical protein XM38_016210 [Halomicronema hongdechloris C2206]|uniref:Uncharacterized protein n=1 Tax=Halomicronema hongdechloris C2206 TaxID=1641165 RepID=A0A1Z3HK91_9CYAN|nr:hypothetical protein [Halomicronema hongdechloris]ASC70676.1 hypothetical protein XM38_016210 [Halomicronema hongdechloris C2206]